MRSKIKVTRTNVVIIRMYLVWLYDVGGVSYQKVIIETQPIEMIDSRFLHHRRATTTTKHITNTSYIKPQKKITP